MITPQSILPKIRQTLRKQGLANTLQDAALKGANLVVPCKILKGINISTPEPAFLQCPNGYTPGFLSERMLRKFSGDPRYEMSPEFLDEALSKEDECYAICDGETLAAYGWYSTKPTRLDLPGLFVHFGGRDVYMYKGFTDTRYRGQRLHAIAMTLALQSYRARGFRGLVSYVEANNFDSLKSCARMGYEIFGTVYVGRISGHYFQHSSRGCREFGFRVAPEPGSMQPAVGASTSPVASSS